MIRALLGLAALACAQTLLAQQATQYLTATHWATPAVEYLIRSGVIEDPDPLTRPLLIGAVLDGLDSAQLDGTSQTVRATVESVKRGLEEEVAAVRVDLYGGVVAATDGRREPLREAGDGYVAGEAGIRPTASFGPIAASTNLYVSQRLKYDPDYTGRKNKWLLHRIPDAYLSLQTKYAQLFIGAVDRNWGSNDVPGVLVSSQSYSYDHLAVRLGTKGVWLEMLYADLDSQRGADGTRINRYWVTHRAAIRPWPWLVVMVNQATLWTGGGRGFELRWLNPLKLSRSTALDESAGDSVNSVYGADMWLALPNNIVFQGTFMVDDVGFQLGSFQPARLAWTALLDVPLGTASIRLGHTLVSSLTYRSHQGGVETFMRRGVGLGRNFSDYTVLYTQVSLLPAPSTVFMPELMLLRQGEGDFRDQFPPPSAISDWPFVFEGVVENTLRVGVRGRATALGILDVGGHAGVHFISNAGNIQGTSTTRFVGGVHARVRWGTAVRLSSAPLH